MDRAFPLFVAEICFSAASQCGKLAFQPFDGKLLSNLPKHGTRIILHHITYEDAKSREHAGQSGNNHARDAERLRQFTGMEAARSAKGHQRELSRIVATFDGDHAYGLLHGGVHDTDDSGSELFRR